VNCVRADVGACRALGRDARTAEVSDRGLQQARGAAGCRIAQVVFRGRRYIRGQVRYFGVEAHVITAWQGIMYPVPMTRNVQAGTGDLAQDVVWLDGLFVHQP